MCAARMRWGGGEAIREWLLPHHHLCVERGAWDARNPTEESAERPPSNMPTLHWKNS